MSAGSAGVAPQASAVERTPMFRRAWLLAIVPAIALLVGCNNDDQHSFKPTATTTVIGNVNPNQNQNTFIALDNDRVAAVGWTMPHDANYLVSYVRLKL